MINISRKALLESVSEAKRFADSKSSMSILATVLLQCEGAVLTVAATNLNMTFVDRLPVSTDVAAAACVDAKKLADVLKVMPGDEVQLDIGEKVNVSEELTWNGKADAYKTCEKCKAKHVVVDVKRNGVDSTMCCKTKDCNGTLLDTKTTKTCTRSFVLSSCKSKFKLNCLAACDFPKLPATDKLEWQTLSAPLLAELIDGVYFSISTDETKAHLNSMLLETQRGIVRAVSTDGHRLSKVERVVQDFALPFAGTVLISRAGVVEIRKHCGKGVANVEIAVEKGFLNIREQGESAVYVIRLADAQFPPYEQVIPHNTDRSAIVNRQNLIASLKRLMLVASERTCGIHWCWTQLVNQTATLLLKADNPDVGNASEELDVRGDRLFESEKLAKKQHNDVQEAERLPFVIGINGKYALEILDKLDGDSVWIGMNGALDPLVFKSDEKSNDVYVVMPMRL